MKAGAHVYLEKPDHLGRRRGAGAGRGSPRPQSRGPGRHAAADDLLPYRSTRQSRSCRPSRQGRAMWRSSAITISASKASRRRRSRPRISTGISIAAPRRSMPYHPNIHPVNWRSFREFGNGYIADLGVHLVDTCRWMLDLGWPKRVSSVGGTSSTRTASRPFPIRRRRSSNSTIC